jgi:hypothetical protein
VAMSEAGTTAERRPAKATNGSRKSGLRKALIRPGTGRHRRHIAVFVFFFIFAGDSGMFNAQGVMNWSTRSRRSS